MADKKAVISVPMPAKGDKWMIQVSTSDGSATFVCRSKERAQALIVQLKECERIML